MVVVVVALVVAHIVPFVVDLGRVALQEFHALMDNVDPVGNIDSLTEDVDTLDNHTEDLVHTVAHIVDSRSKKKRQSS